MCSGPAIGLEEAGHVRDRFRIARALVHRLLQEAFETRVHRDRPVELQVVAGRNIAVLVEAAVQQELTGAERQVLAAYMKTLGKRLLRAEFEAALEMEKVKRMLDGGF